MTSDWSDACDPVPRRELTEAEKRRRAAMVNHGRRSRQWLAPGLDAISAYRIEPDFDELEV